MLFLLSLSSRNVAKLKRLITVEETSSGVSDSLSCSTMTEKVAFSRCFVPLDDKIERKRAKTTNLHNMHAIYTTWAALVDVNNSLEVRYLYMYVNNNRIF